MSKYCGNCGAKILESAKFCIKCGVKIQTEVTDISPLETDFKNNNEKHSSKVYNESSSKKKEDIMAEILNMCEINPDEGLKFIEETIKENPDSASDPFGKFAKAMVFGSKGIFQLARSKPDIDFSCFEEDELRSILGITNTHLDYLEKGLNMIKEMEQIDSNALELFGTKEDNLAKMRVDVMATVLERCRPGRVQEILGKTKLIYFGNERIMTLTKDVHLKNRIEDSPPEKLKPFLNTFFSFNRIVKSALLSNYDKDATGRRYIDCMLFDRTPDNPLPGDTIEETFKRLGSIYIFDDGTFAHTFKS